MLALRIALRFAAAPIVLLSVSGVAQQPRNDGGLGTVKRSFNISAVCKR